MRESVFQQFILADYLFKQKTSHYKQPKNRKTASNLFKTQRVKHSFQKYFT